DARPFAYRSCCRCLSGDAIDRLAVAAQRPLLFFHLGRKRRDLLPQFDLLRLHLGQFALGKFYLAREIALLGSKDFGALLGGVVFGFYAAKFSEHSLEDIKLVQQWLQMADGGVDDFSIFHRALPHLISPLRLAGPRIRPSIPGSPLWSAPCCAWPPLR